MVLYTILLCPTLARLVTNSSLRRWISDVLELLEALKGATRGDWERALVKGLRLCGDMLDARSKRPPPPLILPTPLAPRNAAVPCWRQRDTIVVGDIRSYRKSMSHTSTLVSAKLYRSFNWWNDYITLDHDKSTYICLYLKKTGIVIE